MTKSSNAERAKRVNMAIGLLRKSRSVSGTAVVLSIQYGISKRQAYRYVKEAELAGKQIPVPDRKIPFTVKLSENLAEKTRQYARFKGLTVSEVVTEALEVFLYKDRKRGQLERNGKSH